MSAKSVARLADEHLCPVHGKNMIVTASQQAKVDSRPVARLGDLTTCGAVIVQGDDRCPVDGRPIAYRGSKTSHGGEITSGSEHAFVDVDGA